MVYHPAFDEAVLFTELMDDAREAQDAQLEREAGALSDAAIERMARETGYDVEYVCSAVDEFIGAGMRVVCC